MLKLLGRCIIPKHIGLCRDVKLQPFYFDFDKGKCKPFEYGECDGGGNIFKTVEDCKKECAEFLL